MKQRKAKRGPTMAELWQSIELWLKLQQNNETLELPAGASEGELLLAEVALGVKFPKDLRESYSIHNGTGSIALVPFGQWDVAYPLLPLFGMIGQWKTIQSAVRRGAFAGSAFVNNPTGPIRKAWFHEDWIPIVDDQCGDYFLIDFAPAKGGKAGQIIDFWREKGATNVLADGFLDFIANLAADMEKGKYRFEQKNRTIVRNKKD